MQVGNWKSWTLTKGCTQPSDQSVQSWLDTVIGNQTLQDGEVAVIGIEEAEAEARQESQGDSDSDNSGME